MKGHRKVSFLASVKGRRRVACYAAQIVGLLLACIYLFYPQSFALDPINFCFGTQILSKWNAPRDNYLQPLLKSLVGNADLHELETSGFACDSTIFSLVCVATDHVTIDTKTMEVHMSTRFNLNNSTDFLVKERNVAEVQPYPWAQVNLLKNVAPVKFLREPPQTPARYCDYNQKVPAVVFSSGGFTGNLFHEFDEIIIPLFITSSMFESRVQFIVVDYNPSFVAKFKRIFTKLSKFNILNPKTNTSIHCFPGAVVGLKFHSFLSINSSEVPKGKSILEFKNFLGTTYGFTIKNVSEMGSSPPVLLLVSRRNTRLYSNENELVDMMEELGFEVVVMKSNRLMSNLDKISKLVSTCSVLVGAHGSGLTNMVFLPAGAVVVQVVPLGLEWPSTYYFGEPAGEMGLNYLDYRIGPEESTLIDSYGRDDPVISDPGSIFEKEYNIGTKLYFVKQNIRVDVNRFKGTLIEALQLLGRTTPL